MQLRCPISTDNALMTIFTSGYSEELLFYAVDEDDQHLLFDGQVDVDAQFSFGYVSKKYGNIYFVHEVNEYDGTPNTGAVSRWKIDTTGYSLNAHSLIKQEVSATLSCVDSFPK